MLPDQLNSCGKRVCLSFPVKLSLMSSMLQVLEKKKKTYAQTVFKQ